MPKLRQKAEPKKDLKQPVQERLQCFQVAKDIT